MSNKTSTSKWELENHNKRWTAEDDIYLINNRHKPASILGKELGRTENAINSRLGVIHLKEILKYSEPVPARLEPQVVKDGIISLTITDVTHLTIEIHVK